LEYTAIAKEMQEEILYQYWHYYAICGKKVSLPGGHTLRVLSEGELNRQRGPDIRFARFLFDDIIYQGDVEFHLNASDWYHHGHHLDRAYANVLLHLIARGDAEYVHHQLSDCTIPTYVLPAPVHNIAVTHPAQNCIAGNISINKTQDILMNMALHRLEFKISSYRSALENHYPEIVFYMQFFDALGFPRNRLPFRQLAQKMPLAFIRQLLDLQTDSSDILLAIYFAQAGFLSLKNPDNFSANLIKEYKRHRFLVQTVSVSAENWNLHLVRTQNHPHFRLAAWVQTIRQYHPQSILERIELIMRERPDFSILYLQLFDLFNIDVEDYWKEHYALNKALRHRYNRKYWGKDRIIEIIINVILPLMIAVAEKEGSFGFSAYLKQFYLWLPADINYGVISRNMPWNLSYAKILPRPALFQALLYLNDNYCIDYNCIDCPLKRRPLSKSAAEKVVPLQKDEKAAVGINH
jgi:hypothetical protein